MTSKVQLGEHTLKDSWCFAQNVLPPAHHSCSVPQELYVTCRKPHIKSLVPNYFAAPQPSQAGNEQFFYFTSLVSSCQQQSVARDAAGK